MKRRRSDRGRCVVEIDRQLAASFSPAELEECKEAFSFFDPTGRGYISKSDVSMIYLTLGKLISDSDLETIFKSIGLIGEEVDFNTLLQCVRHPQIVQPDSRQDIRDCFMAIRDENDHIPVAKFSHVMQNMLDRLSEEDVSDVLTHLPQETKKKRVLQVGSVTIATSSSADDLGLDLTGTEVEYEVIGNEDALFDLMITKKY